jgi:hypothetical protein
LLASGERISKFGFDLGFVVDGRFKAARDRKPLGVRTVAIRVVIFVVCIILLRLFGRYHELVFWLNVC